MNKEKVYAYIDADLAKDLEALSSAEVIGKTVIDYFSKQKTLLFANIEDLNFDTITLQRQLKEARAKLEEAIKEEVHILENLWNTSSSKIRSFRELLTPVREDIQLIAKELKEVTTLIYSLDIDKVQRAVTLIKELRALTNEDKSLAEFLAK